MVAFVVCFACFFYDGNGNWKEEKKGKKKYWAHSQSGFNSGFRYWMNGDKAFVLCVVQTRFYAFFTICHIQPHWTNERQNSKVGKSIESHEFPLPLFQARSRLHYGTKVFWPITARIYGLIAGLKNVPAAYDFGLRFFHRIR